MPRGVGYYGYPDESELVRRAMRLGRASVPTAGSVRRQYGQAIGDVGGFTSALVSLLRGSDPGGAYDEAIAQQRQVDEAAQARLGALGPEFAGAAVTSGSQGDSALSRLLAGQAASAAYGRKQPGIAASRGALGQTGLVNARQEALTQRNEALRSAFVQSYENVRQNALAMAMANADISQADRAFREQRRQFNVGAAASAAGGGAAGPPDVNEDFQQVRDKLFSMADEFYNRTTKGEDNPYMPGDQGEERPDRVSYDKAFKRMRSYARPYLRQLGYSNKEITRIIRQALKAAGYQRSTAAGYKPGLPG